MAELCLGIETSCDETAAAVVAAGRRLVSSRLASQIALHADYGGVVPELASREHALAIMPVIHSALAEAGAGLSDLDCIAVTYGPGLVGSLLVGLSAGKGLSLASGVPLVGVNHVEGHIYANFLEHRELEPPAVCLTASGGHTELVYVEALGAYRVLGRSRDDAAGEALDKVGRVLGLGYPAGPELERLAQGGDPKRFPFPRALADELFAFSFSGLKTAGLNLINQFKQRGEALPVADFAASFQEAVVEALVEKSRNALAHTGARTLLAAGGVAANSRLRARLAELAAEFAAAFYYPSPALCTDNAAMIAAAGYFRFRQGERAALDLNAEPGLRLAAP
ncbi:MAG TPA: tRNA (adenosine(37)-N6)-threonylcarbamoyltransferase complex transferase subunit TsaD [Limnochordia bacterium]|nr:tRNA (adenosine(37)-N6)-threonylcarbamoyltransferase complex transferase subunit TsaD [Limnochordia bacterium]